jgi:hypothetical protein
MFGEMGEILLASPSSLVGLAARSRAPSVASLASVSQFSPPAKCNLCLEPLFDHEPRWKATCAHYGCGSNWEKASRPCRGLSETSELGRAFNLFKMKSKEGEEGETDEVLQLKKKIAKNYGTAGFKPQEVKSMMVQAWRKKQVARSEEYEGISLASWRI